MTANLSVGAAHPEAMTGSAAGPDATIYTTPDCVQCVATKRAFEKLVGVSYTLVDVSADREARDMLADMGYRSAPVVITATGEHWSGFRPDRIHALSNQVFVSRIDTASVGTAGDLAAPDHTTPTRPPPALDGPGREWAQAMAQRMRTRTRAATDTGLSL